MNDNFSKAPNVSFMPKQSASTTGIIEVILLIIVSGLFSWFVILPKKTEVDAKKADLVKAQEDQSQIADKLATLNKLSSALKLHPNEVADLDESLPLDGKTLHLQSLIRSLADSAGVSVSAVSVSGGGNFPVAGDKALLANPFGITRSVQKLSGSVFVIGNFSQIQAFLEKIEKNSRIMDVSTIRIDSTPEGLLNLQLSLNAYYFGR